MTEFWCDAKLVWLCECAWLELDVVALAAQRSWGGGQGGRCHSNSRSMT